MSWPDFSLIAFLLGGGTGLTVYVFAEARAEARRAEKDAMRAIRQTPAMNALEAAKNIELPDGRTVEVPAEVADKWFGATELSSRHLLHNALIGIARNEAEEKLKRG